MTVIGIDPGLTGYCAMIHGQDIEFFATPVIDYGKRTIYNLPGMAHLVRSWTANNLAVFVVLEKQQAFPKQGSVSNFTTGFGYGIWRAMLTFAGISVTEVRPQAWKKALGLAGVPKADRKARSIEKAQQLYPMVDLRPLEQKPGARKPSHGKAEALLLAHFGLTTANRS